MQYLEYTDGIDTYREGVRDGKWVVDHELDSSPGFEGDEDIDWKNVETSQ